MREDDDAPLFLSLWYGVLGAQHGGKYNTVGKKSAHWPAS